MQLQMKRVKITKKILFLGLGWLLTFTGLLWFLNWEVFSGNRELKSLLTNKLTKAVPLSVTDGAQTSRGDAIYVLGGSARSLQDRFYTASVLYNKGISKRILIDSDPSMTEYRVSMGRNLTMNEWAIEHLVALGVKKEDIEPVSLEKGFFGTFQEAKGISDIVLKRGYKDLVLVTSSYHTMRTWKSFSKFLKDKGLNLYIYMAPDNPGIYTLLKEYVKLEVYDIFLLRA